MFLNLRLLLYIQITSFQICFRFPGSETTAFYDEKKKAIFLANVAFLRIDLTFQDHCQSLNRMLYAKEHPKDYNKCDPSSHTNYRHLNSEEKDERVKRLHKKCITLTQEISRVQAMLDQALEQRGVTVGEDLHKNSSVLLTKNHLLWLTIENFIY